MLDCNNFYQNKLGFWTDTNIKAVGYKATCTTNKYVDIMYGKQKLPF
jgi:hypothetical protein